MPTAHEIVDEGKVIATGNESVHVGFDVSPGQRRAVATLLAEHIDLSKPDAHDTLGYARLLDSGDVAVHIREEKAELFGWDE